MPLQDVPLWHVNCFELMAVKTQKTWKNFATFPLTIQKNLHRGPVPGKELLPETASYIRKTDLHGVANICLPNILSTHFPVNSHPLL